MSDKLRTVTVDLTYAQADKISEFINWFNQYRTFLFKCVYGELGYSQNEILKEKKLNERHEIFECHKVIDQFKVIIDEQLDIVKEEILWEKKERVEKEIEEKLNELKSINLQLKIEGN